MIKEERFKTILNVLSTNGTIKVSDIMKELHVSDMTVRRDLAELENEGLLKRVHGGAKLNNFTEELSHTEKQIIHVEEKFAIATRAASLIEPHDTIFLGPGTTVELLAQLINPTAIRVVTNCLPVFDILMKKEIDKVYLLGGEIRMNTQAFFGEITNNALANMNFHKSFFSCNALRKKQVMTATMEEGQTQMIALNNSLEKYLLVDSSKIGKDDFCVYYHLDELTGVITNKDPQNHYLQIEHNQLLLG